MIKILIKKMPVFDDKIWFFFYKILYPLQHHCYFLMICDSMSAEGFPAFRRSNNTFHTLRSYSKDRKAKLLQRLQALTCPGKRFFTCGIVYTA